MRTPFISVIIPAYNAEPWIDKTLVSVFHQTYRADSIELLVIDDSSTDRTNEIVFNCLQNSPIQSRVIKGTYGSPSKARNAGLLVARGNWIQFLDADDLLAADKLERQATCAMSSSAEVAGIYS